MKRFWEGLKAAGTLAGLITGTLLIVLLVYAAPVIAAGIVLYWLARMAGAIPG